MLSNQKRPHYLNHGQKPLNIYVDERPAGMNGGHEAPPNGRVLDRKPSRLEQMRADYQKKIMKEKEEKMVMMYEENQRKAMDRIMRHDASPNGGKSVREFFNERRRLEASGAHMPPIDNHYRKAKGYNSPGGWSSRTGSGNSVRTQKISAGRDRSNPLAPIRRPMDTQEVSNNQKSRIPHRQQMNNGYHGYDGDNPFTDKPKLVKHKPLPSSNGYGGHENSLSDENGYSNFRQTQMKYSPQHTKQSPHPPPRPPQSQRQQQRPQARPGPHSRPPANGQVSDKSPSKGHKGQQKMTDFQKWQMEQNKAREDRLKKFNNERHSSPYDGSFGGGDEYEYQDEDDVEEEEDGIDDDITKQERELMEKIARQQAELDRVKTERHKLEQEEKRDREKQKKKEAMERARQRQLEEEERKEDERRRKEEEEEMRMEKQREEKRRKEMEKQMKEDEKRRKEEEKHMAKRQREEEKRMREHEKRMREEERRLAKQQAKLSVRKGYSEDNHNEYEEESAPISLRRTSTVPQSSRTYDSPTKGNVTNRSQAGDFDEQPAIANAGSNYYAQVAKSSEAKGSVGKMSSCRHCGRTFAADRLQKHQNACSKVQKPRKEFDSSRKRVEGTDLAKYAGKTKRYEPPKKKSDWRAKREEFIQGLRYARACAQVEKEGGDVRDLAPPPPSKNLDLVPCPFCNRTFNEQAAERHIPRCKDLKTKPPPINTRRR